MLQPLLVFGLALALSLAATPAVIRVLLNSRIMDVPNRRSSHAVPVPRGGGFGILLPFALITGGLLLAGGLRSDAYLPALLLGMAGLTLIGFLDDILSLSALLRLALEGALMAVCLALSPLALTQIDLPMLAPLPVAGPVGWLLAWLFLVGFPNLFNFMDGIDGLAGTQTVIAGLALALLAHLEGRADLALLCAAVAGGGVGFLRHNLPRARVFMGDSGSLPIGFFLAAVVLVLAGPGGSLPLPAPVLVLWVFLFDAGLTLTIRACRGRRLHHAHRQHLYQRLVASGLAHVRVTALYGLAMIGAAAAALVYRQATDPWRLVLAAAVLTVSAALAAVILRLYRLRVVHGAVGRTRDD